MSRKRNWEAVYVCNLCKTTTRSYNRNTCPACGAVGTWKEKSGRWVDTTTLFETLTLSRSGYWELKEDEEIVLLNELQEKEVEAYVKTLSSEKLIEHVHRYKDMPTCLKVVLSEIQSRLSEATLSEATSGQKQ
jgi:DNA-directed RNA polymerase subunit RPC12/RpoP